MHFFFQESKFEKPEMAEGGDVERVSFVCQRCLQPLRIDPSFYSMSEHTYAELSLNFLPAPEIDLETSESKLDHYVPPFKLNQDACGGAKGQEISKRNCPKTQKKILPKFCPSL